MLSQIGGRTLGKCCKTPHCWYCCLLRVVVLFVVVDETKRCVLLIRWMRKGLKKGVKKSLHYAGPVHTSAAQGCSLTFRASLLASVLFNQCVRGCVVIRRHRLRLIIVHPKTRPKLGAPEQPGRKCVMQSSILAELHEMSPSCALYYTVMERERNKNGTK